MATDVSVATVKRIERITKRLERELGLIGWLLIKHVFDPGYDGDTALEQNGTLSVYKTSAITTAQWQYRFATIRWFLPTCSQQSDDMIELIAIHEYIHAVLAPLTAQHHKSMNSDLEEFVTESLARMIGYAKGLEGIG